MAYFNHAFNKLFLGTSINAGGNINLGSTAAGDAGGFLLTGGLPTVDLTVTGNVNPNLNYGPGTFGFFDPETWLSIDPTAASYNGCCPIVLVAAPLVTNDKIGPFHGGYKETNKSKIINPKFVQKIYQVSSCTPQQAVTSIGHTPYTQAGGPGAGNSSCLYEFLCGETYYLRVDLKGSPALRFANHQIYQNIYTYTGCCNSPLVAGDPIDSTLVMIGWASELAKNPYTQAFVASVVYSEQPQVSTFDAVAYTEWYAPGTTTSPVDGSTINEGQWWDYYPTGTTHNVGSFAGLRIAGAYVDTKFGNCSFQLTDFFEKELISIHASLVDINGDPCTFEGICVINDCNGVQGMGFGEQVVRDLILSESYLQNFFATDVRIREITQGDQILASVNRNALYTRYFILHNVPRYNNPTGMFDSDRYLLEIITNGNMPLLDTFLSTWSAACAECATPTLHDCTHCTIEDDNTYVPLP